MEELNEIANKIVELSKRVESEVKKNFLEIGLELKQAKEICYEKKLIWKNWIKQNLELSLSQCDKLIKTYEYSLKDPNIRFLSFKQAYSMITHSSREESNVKQFKPKEPEQMIEIKQSKLDELNKEMEGLKMDNEGLNKEIKKVEQQESYEPVSLQEPQSKSDKILEELTNFLEENLNPSCECCNQLLAKLSSL